MRKRDKVKGVTPYLIGLVNLWFISVVISSLEITLDGVGQIVVVLLWALLTGLGVIRMDKIIDAWDKDDKEED